MANKYKEGPNQKKVFSYDGSLILPNNVYVVAYMASTTSFAHKATFTYVFDTEVVDSKDAYDHTTGIFTAPTRGVYALTAFSMGTYQTTASTNYAKLMAYKNGSVDTTMYQADQWAAHAYGGQLTAFVQLAAQDTVSIRGYADMTGSAATYVIVGGAGRCVFNLIKIS